MSTSSVRAGHGSMIDLNNGRINDRYEVRERIGSGGMARVYKAWDTNLERLVAIKILHEHLADDPAFKERFEREAKFIASFNHPNIVQVYDYDVINREGFPLCYMVMSYIPGKTLREVLEEAAVRGERLPRERVRELVDDLSSALGYAHQRGMVHRDVKPGNIILNEHGNAVLTDFGIARMVQSNRLTADGVSTGTPIYMSPEQASGEAGDARSDLYSLGIIVYEMLTSRPPFVDDSSLSVMLKHLNAIPPAPSAFIGTRQFDALLAKALAKKPDERCQSAEAFARAFHATFEPSASEPADTVSVATESTPPVVGAPPVTTSVLQTLSQRARENPRTSTAIFVAALGMVALLVLLLTSASPARDAAPPEPTSAPTAIAQATSATSSIVYFASSFNSGDPFNQYWSTDSTEFLTREFTPDGFYRMHNLRAGTAETSIFPSAAPYGSMSIDMVGRLELSSQPASAYGIVFRYQDEDNYNVFAVDGMGRYSIWVRSEGEWIELRQQDEKWTPNTVIQPVGKSNILSVTVLSNVLIGYVNNRQMVRVTDDTFKDGRIGMYFATDDGEATVSVDSYRVYSTIPSMTVGVVIPLSRSAPETPQCKGESNRRPRKTPGSPA